MAVRHPITRRLPFAGCDCAEPSRRSLECPPGQRPPAAVRCPQADSAGQRLDARRSGSGRLLRRARGYSDLAYRFATNSSGRWTEPGSVVASCGVTSFAASDSSKQENPASRSDAWVDSCASGFPSRAPIQIRARTRYALTAPGTFSRRREERSTVDGAGRGANSFSILVKRELDVSLVAERILRGSRE